ncbi:tumor necrosis factor receptor superfamily member 5-like isoform X2 [Corythoichthys intestinalis]|uniref:tumor necrosis factor receptor superfamily member 5-like isoform X2 n=1 Tax=Corythoichthys intestinalis TaxID=161448 RepID=UPI0025A68E13|nr:tumor necrosis factor receptor superfamily member 5-like isoform X2 [Corythoichthys intestinalis]
MVSPHPFLTTLYALYIWMFEYTTGMGCPPQKTLMNGKCCELCPPGEYLKEFCTETTETVCQPCPDNSFSGQHNAFDRCEECQACQGAYQEREKKCSPTTNAKCSCRPGFLCFDDACSQCMENPCAAGEKVVKTGDGLIPQYNCQPACPDHEYLDEMNICRKRIQCNKEDLAKQFRGNRTHDASCHRNDTDKNAVCVTYCVGCAVLALLLLVILTHKCVKVAKKRRADKTVVVTPLSLNDTHMSKEESGFHQLIIQTDSNKTHLQEIVTTLS